MAKIDVRVIAILVLVGVLGLVAAIQGRHSKGDAPLHEGTASEATISLPDTGDDNIIELEWPPSSLVKTPPTASTPTTKEATPGKLKTAGPGESRSSVRQPSPTAPATSPGGPSKPAAPAVSTTDYLARTEPSSSPRPQTASEEAISSPASPAGRPPAAAWSAGPGGVEPGFREYTVRKNDSLYLIAKRELGDGSKYRLLYVANRDRLKSPDAILRVGMKLRIPVPREVNEIGAFVDKPLYPAVESRSSSEDGSPRPGEATSSTGGRTRYYTVRKNDNFTKIAKRLYKNGRFWRRLYEANRRRLKLSRPEDLRVGQKLIVPEL